MKKISMKKCCKQCGQVYGHHDNMAITKTRGTKHEVYKEFMCTHSLNTSLPLLKVSQGLK